MLSHGFGGVGVVDWSAEFEALANWGNGLCSLLRARFVVLELGTPMLGTPVLKMMGFCGVFSRAKEGGIKCGFGEKDVVEGLDLCTMREEESGGVDSGEARDARLL